MYAVAIKAQLLLIDRNKDLQRPFLNWTERFLVTAIGDLRFVGLMCRAMFVRAAIPVSGRCRRSGNPAKTVASCAARLQSSMRPAQRELVLSPAANPSGSGVYVAVKCGNWLTGLMFCRALSIADVDRFSVNSQTASAAN